MSKDKQLKIIEEEFEVDVIDEEGVGVPTRIEPTPISLPKMMEMAEMLSKSTIVPVEYRNRPENTFLAIDYANRMGMSPMAIMQNMYVVQGKPSFSGSFVSALIKSSPLFSQVEVVWVDEDKPESPTWGCYIQAVETRTGKLVKGVTVDNKMIKGEGWERNSKWKTMRSLMVQYRAWSFFGRTHASELLNGILDIEELEDIKVQKQGTRNPYKKE